MVDKTVKEIVDKAEPNVNPASGGRMLQRSGMRKRTKNANYYNKRRRTKRRRSKQRK